MTEKLLELVKDIDNPISLGAFSLLLAFIFLASKARSDERRWLAPVFVVLATVSLIGGLVVSFQSESVKKSVSNNPVAQPSVKIEKLDVTSTGSGIAIGIMLDGEVNVGETDKLHNSEKSEN